MADREWMGLALCRGVDPAFFHPAEQWQFDYATRICRACPVAQECGTYALEVAIPGGGGVWAGLREDEYVVMRRPRATA